MQAFLQKYNKNFIIMNKEDARLIGELTLAIIAILFTVYRELKEKGKIAKLKKIF